MIPNKQAIRYSFNAATKTYDAASDWQKKVGDLLLKYIDQLQPKHKTILDLGAGTGYLTHHMQQRYPNNRFVMLDIAENMLLFSKQQLSHSSFICADAENTPLQNECIDIIISNMVLHWCHSLEKTLYEQYKILAPNGLLIFSVLGSESLHSLKTAWQRVDHYSHINDFPNAKIIKEACHSVGFSLLDFGRYEIKKHYENLDELMNHLKATGAKNVSSNRPKGLMGKQKIKQLREQYKNPLSYEVFIVVSQKRSCKP